MRLQANHETNVSCFRCESKEKRRKEEKEEDKDNGGKCMSVPSCESKKHCVDNRIFILLGYEEKRESKSYFYPK